MDVIKYLETDHEKVLSLLTKLYKTSTSSLTRREELFSTTKEELYLHEQVEQQILYPALKKKSKATILEAIQEHHFVNLLLADIENTPFDHENFKPKIMVLFENVKHHIKEERSQLFPLTRKHYNKADREKMMEQMEQIKADLKSAEEE